jgi:hypothetical protein
MYENARTGLCMYFYAQIGIYLFLVLMFFNLPFIVPLVACFILTIIQIVGLRIIKNDNDDFKTAYILMILYWLIMWAANLSRSVALLSLLFRDFGYIVTYFAVRNICISTKQALILSGRDEGTLNRQTDLVLLLQFAKVITEIVISILSMFEIYYLPIVLLYAVVIVISQILLLKFIYQSTHEPKHCYVSSEDN